MNALFKSALKRIFPTYFLKKLHLAYNSVRILTIDRVIFPEYVVNPKLFTIYRKGHPFRENGIDIATLQTEEVRSYMRQWFDWTQEEFMLKFETPCVIEPDFGWAIVGANRLLYYSLGISRTWFQPKPAFFRLLFRRNVQHLPTAVSLRDTGEENYFHFYNDVLTKLFFLREQGVHLEDIPIVIGKKLWDKPYFQYYLKKNSEVKNLNWVIQDRQYLEIKTVFFCKALTHRADLLTKAFRPWANLTRIPKSKIFLSRSKSRVRHLVNTEEVELTCKKYNFEVVDADQLSIERQIDLFSHAAVVVGIHGAGLTNLMFCPDSCRVVEIFPFPSSGYLPFHYIMLAKMKKLDYSAVIGSDLNGFSSGFYLSKKHLDDVLSRLA